MQRYKFKARNEEGVMRKGVVEANTKEAAAEILKGQNLYIIELHSQKDNKSALFSFMDKVKFDDVVNFTRQLSTMIAAGLPLTDSLSILEVQSDSSLQPVISDILRSIEGGSSFGDALEKHEDVFSDVYIALIRAGEAAGVLDTILARLADNLEKQREFRAKTKGALIYPVIVLIGMFAVTLVMMIFVLPKLSVMYEDFDAELPLMTKLLIGTSTFMANTWYVFLLIIGGIIYGVRKWKSTKFGALKWDQMVLKLPIFGQIKKQTTMAEFARTLSLLVGAGVALVDALKIVTGVVDNQVYAGALENVAKDVEKGNPLAGSLAKYEAFPLIVPQMVSVGEQTGKLDEILERLSLYFERESEHAIKNLSTAMEPFIMVILGIGVGFLIVAIVIPIYNLTSAF